jgi:hypothetical protein
VRIAINQELDAIKKDIEAANKAMSELIELLEKQMAEVFNHLHARIDGENTGGPKDEIEPDKNSKN